MALITSHTNMAGLITTAIRRKFVPILRNKLRIDPFAAKGQLQVHGGGTALRWNRAADIGVYTTALGEVTTTQNEVATITITAVVQTVSDYGAFTKIADLADKAWTRETRQEFAEIFAYSAAKTRDSLLRNVVYDNSTSNHYFCAGDTAADQATITAADTAIAQDLNGIRGFFDAQDCDGFDEVDGNYAVFIHGTIEQDMVGDVTTTRLSWSPLLQNVNPQAGRITAYKGPGALLGCAVLRTNNLSSAVLTTGSTPGGALGTTVYKCIALADHGIGKTTLDQSEPRIIMKRPGNQTISVPLDTYGVLGWKLRMAQGVIDPLRCLVYYASAPNAS